MTITEEREIDCEPAVVFDVMADVRNEAKWNDSVSKAEILTGDPVREGSQFVTVHGPPLGDITSTITTFERPGRLDFSATSKRMDLAMSLTFTESASGTTMHLTVEPQPRGFMALLFPLLRPMIRRDMVKQHQNLKELCESHAR